MIKCFHPLRLMGFILLHPAGDHIFKEHLIKYEYPNQANLSFI